MQLVCGTLLALSPFIAIFLIYSNWQRIQQTGSLVMREEYQRTENGNIIGAGLIFDIENQVLSIKNQRDISFDDIRGVYIETLRSHRVGVGIFTNDDEMLLSVITNNDINIAAQNAGLIADVVAHQADKFQNAVKNHVWSQAVVGTRFEFKFKVDSSD